MELGAKPVDYSCISLMVHATVNYLLCGVCSLAKTAKLLF